jgi:hypothetical protein
MNPANEFAACDSMTRHRVSTRSWTQRMNRFVMASYVGAVRSAWSMIKLTTQERIPVCGQGVARVLGQDGI